MCVVTFSDLDFVLSLRARESRTSSWCPEVGLGILVSSSDIFDGAMSCEDASCSSSWCPEFGLGIPTLTSGHLGSFDEILKLLAASCSCRRSHVRMLMELSRLDLPETSRSGPPPEGPENCPNGPRACRRPKRLRNDLILK